MTSSTPSGWPEKRNASVPERVAPHASIAEALDRASERLAAAGLPSARREATSLWAVVAGKKPGDVWLSREDGAGRGGASAGAGAGARAPAGGGEGGRGPPVPPGGPGRRRGGAPPPPAGGGARRGGRSDPAVPHRGGVRRARPGRTRLRAARGAREWGGRARRDPCIARRCSRLLGAAGAAGRRDRRTARRAGARAGTRLRVGSRRRPR